MREIPYLHSSTSSGVHTFSCDINLILTNDEDKFIRWTKYIEFNYTGIIFNFETIINKSSKKFKSFFYLKSLIKIIERF